MGAPDIHLNRTLDVGVQDCIGRLLAHLQPCQALKPTWGAPSRPVSRLYPWGTASCGPGCSRCAGSLDITGSAMPALLAGNCGPSRCRRSTDPLPQLGGPATKASSLAPGAAICSVSGAGSGPVVVPLESREHSRDRMSAALTCSCTYLLKTHGRWRHTVTVPTICRDSSKRTADMAVY